MRTFRLNFQRPSYRQLPNQILITHIRVCFISVFFKLLYYKCFLVFLLYHFHPSLGRLSWCMYSWWSRLVLSEKLINYFILKNFLPNFFSFIFLLIFDFSIPSNVSPTAVNAMFITEKIAYPMFSSGTNTIAKAPKSGFKPFHSFIN